MGRVTHTAKLTNVADALAVGLKLKQPDSIRSVQVEFLVDTGAAMVCLPLNIIEELGLLYDTETSVRTANGIVTRSVYSPVRVEMFGRHAITQVMENDDTTPPLIGYIALEIMDLQINPKEQALMPNPANNGKWLIDLF
jgi:clan AA aspartic protease